MTNPNATVKTLTTLAATGLLAGVVISLRATAQVQGGQPAYVKLQSTTPGTPQNGHANLAGTIRAGRLEGDGSGLTAINAAAVGTGVLSSQHGGTGSDTSSAPLGSLLFADGAGLWGALPPGADSQVLTMSGGVPGWADATGLSLPYNGSAAVPGDSAFQITNTDVSGAAIKGVASSATGYTYGGLFESYGDGGRAIQGNQLSPTGPTFGGRFGVVSNQGVGLGGIATSPTGETYGVKGENLSTDFSAGVFGIGQIGVRGDTTAKGGWGVYGVVYQKPTSFGLYGGVVGNYAGNDGGIGVFSFGVIAATGTKQFVIDHPLDPQNKILRHYCSEGPEPLNVYRGTIVTDSAGYATVRLPDYFQALNTNPTVQLTVVDSSQDFVLAKVVQRPVNNEFVVRTSKGRTTVDWRVEARRNDAHVKRFGAPVEEDKPASMRGKYLDPAAYGLPQTMSAATAVKAGRPGP
ncbi:MAG: hypothetical protein JSS66_08040 [Armatimonadetes bacterium]|nr:hypothetical protein [Armatimonadota bacterium]